MAVHYRLPQGDGPKGTSPGRHNHERMDNQAPNRIKTAKRRQRWGSAAHEWQVEFEQCRPVLEHPAIASVGDVKVALTVQRHERGFAQAACADPALVEGIRAEAGLT